MPKIQIDVQDQVLTATPDKLLVSQSVGEVAFEADFDESWDDYTKTIIFSTPRAQKSVLYTGGTMTIPWEVLDRPTDSLRISAVGIKAGHRRPTAHMRRGLAVALSGAIEGGPPAEYTPALWEQVMANLGRQDNAIIKRVSELATKSEATPDGGAYFYDIDLNEVGIKTDYNDGEWCVSFSALMTDDVTEPHQLRFVFGDNKVIYNRILVLSNVLIAAYSDGELRIQVSPPDTDAALIRSSADGETRNIMRLVYYSSVLKKMNTTEYTPRTLYNPATKKYVDDTVLETINTIKTPVFQAVALMEDIYKIASEGAAAIVYGTEEEQYFKLQYPVIVLFQNRSNDGRYFFNAIDSGTNTFFGNCTKDGVGMFGGTSGRPAAYPAQQWETHNGQMIMIHPNVFYDFGEVMNVSIQTLSSDESYRNEYCGTFSTGDPAPSVGFPSDVRWPYGFTIAANKSYRFSIINGIGVMLEAELPQASEGGEELL